MPGALLLAGVTVALLLAARRPVVRRLVAVGTAAVVLGALPVRILASGWPPAGWVVVGCAVGQGDALVLPVAAARAVVVDAGPEPSAVDGCLRRLGVREVSLLVVSHFHADHVGGVAGVFRGRRMVEVRTPGLAEPAAGRALVAVAGAVVLRATEAGWSYRAGGVELVALGPPYPLHGTRWDPNGDVAVVTGRHGLAHVRLRGRRGGLCPPGRASVVVHRRP